jgi:hypothetical protein
MDAWGYFMVAWFACCLGFIVVQVRRYRMHSAIHRMKMGELKEIDAITDKAAAAKTTEEFEYYVSEASRRLTEYSKKYPG